ncbi:MAG TPA: PhaM family polyhydroxyalkanoate granule multifunctional regulatory protein [Casimicrobiaceae bacterium]|jgi:hypothetical protein
MSDKPSPFTPQQALEFMQKMWNPFGLSMPGVIPPPAPGVAPAAAPFPNPLAMFATLDPAEIDKKIGELRVIENWLTMSLNFMQMSIKTLELQKASLEALHAGAAAASEAAPKKHKAKEGG